MRNFLSEHRQTVLIEGQIGQEKIAGASLLDEWKGSCYERAEVNMFGLKKLFGKKSNEPLPAPPAAPPAPPPSAPARPAAPVAPVVTAPPINSAAESGEKVGLPLKSIVSLLPGGIFNIVQAYGTETVMVPLDHIIEQLPKGIVRVSFDYLRRISPPGTFADVKEHDSTAVELPLKDILERIDSSLLARRPNQKQIKIASDIRDLFGAKGELIRHLDSTPPAAPATAASPISPTSPVTTPTATAAKAESDSAEVLSVPLASLSEKWPEEICEEIAALDLKKSLVALPMSQIEPALKKGKISFTWKQLRDWLKPTVPSAASQHFAATLDLPLAIVAPLFLAQKKPAAAAQKKVTIAENIPSLFSETSNSFTLAKPPEKGSAPAAQSPKPAEPPAVSPQPPAPAPVAEEQKIKFSLPPTVEKPVAAVEEKIKMPEASPIQRNASPQEIVEKTCALPGVAGALVAMQDGLLVAGKLTGALKPENVAAFLPQIFGRMNEYSKELALGELNSLVIQAQNIPWQIVKTGKVYFLVAGRAGENLPTVQLNAIAAELNRQTQ